MTEKRELKTIDIKGKPYVMVHERVREFRENKDYEGLRIITEVVDLNDDRIVMKASVLDVQDKVQATGHAFEYAEGGQINKTSFVENCETSAIGRCLGALGIGVLQSFATAEEVAQAIHQQKDERPWLSQNQFDKSVSRIQGANPNVEIEKDGNMLEVTPEEYLKMLKETFRMKREYKESLKHEVEFQKIVGKE